ncbi:MAG: hypothetical protein AB2L09_02615 [Coriobacteriia bacterium]
MDTQSDRVTLKLEASKVTASEFKRAVNAFLDMIREVADDVAGGPKHVSWVVSVEAGSACLVAEPVPVASVDRPIIPAALSAIRNGISEITARTTIPQHWSETAVRHVAELAALSGDNVPGKSISVRFGIDAPISLTKTTADNVGKMFAAHTYSLGSIEGRLEMMSLRSGFKCNIYDMLTDRRVNCTYSDNLFEDVRAALGERVSAYGLISYASDGRLLNLKIQSVRVLGRSEDLPTWDDVKGILQR